MIEAKSLKISCDVINRDQLTVIQYIKYIKHIIWTLSSLGE